MSDQSVNTIILGQLIFIDLY